MFAWTKSPVGMAAPSDVSAVTVIGQGTEFTGDLVISGVLRVHGRVVGNITAQPGSTSSVEISLWGMVEGSITVPRVLVQGEVKGDVGASDILDLMPTSRVSGDVSYGVLQMSVGATVKGNLRPLAERTERRPTLRAITNRDRVSSYSDASNAGS